MSAVIDASVALAAILGEPGADSARASFAGGRLSAVNYSEVIGKLVQKGFSDDDAVQAAGELGLEIVPLEQATAMLAGVLMRHTARRGLSLGDRACLALALSSNSRAVTADRGWAGLNVGVEIEVIR